jgi:uncharacterized protein YjaG (DUF416 family)
MRSLVPHDFEVARRLADLSTQARAVFSASCAERLYPSYALFAVKSGLGDAAALRSLLDQVWSHLLGDARADLPVLEPGCEQLLPPDDPWIDESAAADDAVASACYALNCAITGDAKAAATSARRVCEAIDSHIIAAESIDTTRRGADTVVELHPMMRAEYRRQLRDLDALVDTPFRRSVIEEIRERARQEASALFRR